MMRPRPRIGSIIQMIMPTYAKYVPSVIVPSITMIAPIVALTANAMSHQIDEYMQSGMDALVAKPIEAQRLYEAVQRALEGAAEDARTAAA